MKIAVVGSRDLNISEAILKEYLFGASEIVSGGARGVDSCAAEYSRKNRLVLTEFLPEYELYGRAAPIIRNREIVEYADKVIVFWNGRSKGALSVIKYAEKIGKSCKVVLVDR